MLPIFSFFLAMKKILGVPVSPTRYLVSIIVCPMVICDFYLPCLSIYLCLSPKPHSLSLSIFFFLSFLLEISPARYRMSIILCPILYLWSFPTCPTLNTLAACSFTSFHNLSFSLSFYLSICLSISFCLSVCLSLSAYQSVSFSFAHYIFRKNVTVSPL